MKTIISYLKLDLRISKKSLLIIIPPIIFMAYMFFDKQAYILGISYLLLLQVVFANTPFIVQESENLKQLHYILPSKVSKMVLSRFIYLIICCLVVYCVVSILIVYLHSINEINNRDIVIILLCEIIVNLILFIQYPISYKLGLHNRNFLMNSICTLPGIIMCLLPTFLIESRLFLILNLDKDIDFIVNNCISLFSFSILILVILGYISYFVSYRVCRRKEI